MRSQYATDVPSSGLLDLHDALSAGSGWNTNGAGITVPRRHLGGTNIAAPPPAAKPHSALPFDPYYSEITAFTSLSEAESHYGHSRAPETISDAIAAFKVDPDVLSSRYGRSLSVVRVLIGVAPNAFALLDIFPPALRALNALVPALLNVPSLLLGLSAPGRHVGLAMYHASKSARCAYCTVHTASFALRRGAHAATISGRRPLSRREATIARVARNIAAFPPALTFADRRDLHAAMSRAHVEWIVLSVAMMGMLNLTMTALGVDLEQTTVDSTGPLIGGAAGGWSSGRHRIVPPSSRRQEPERRPLRGDTFRSNLSVLRKMPAAAARFDADTARHVPKAWPAVGDFLVARVGHSFPIFSRLRHARAVRALAAALCTHLDEAECSIDVEVKYLAAVVFATVNGNHVLSGEFQALASAKSAAVSAHELASVTAFAAESSSFQNPFLMSRNLLPDTVLTLAQKRILYVAKACSLAPPVISPPMVALIRDTMPPPQIVELVSWLGLVATFHRLYVFYIPNCLDRSFLHEAALGNEMDDGDDDILSDMS